MGFFLVTIKTFSYLQLSAQDLLDVGNTTGGFVQNLIVLGRVVCHRNALACNVGKVINYRRYHHSIYSFGFSYVCAYVYCQRKNKPTYCIMVNLLFYVLHHPSWLFCFYGRMLKDWRCNFYYSGFSFLFICHACFVSSSW